MSKNKNPIQILQNNNGFCLKNLSERRKLGKFKKKWVWQTILLIYAKRKANINTVN